MDKRKYLSKTLIAQYEFFGSFDEEDRFIELAYKLKDNSLIIEYSGTRFSIYGIKINFSKDIPRKGIYKISQNEFERWKYIRSREKRGSFTNWEQEQEEQFELDHENQLKCVGLEELPF
jgi:hypothetical protein